MKGLGLIVSLFLPGVLAAQTGRLTGTVVDSAQSQPIVGARVMVTGTQIGALTGPDGRYTVGAIPAGTRSITVQRLGFAPVTRSVVITAGGVTTLNVTMLAQSVRLAEVVSVGYGTQRARDIAGSVTNVTTEALESSPISSIDQLIQGTAPGVQVTTASGEPGGALSIRIRGTASITGNSEPLYVIDGFPIENDIEGSSVGNGGRDRTTPPNPLVTLNPSDIESISILKDASATSIYGARGANGVVIITTKQGKGAKPTFSLDMYTGATQLAKRYDLLDAAGYMDYANAYGENSSSPFTPFPDSVKAAVLASGVNTDWQDQVFRTGGVKNLQLSVRGATSTAQPTRYSLSGGVFDQDGIVVGSGLRRLSGRLSLNQAIGSRLEIGGTVTAARARSKSTPTSGQQNANAGAVSGALQYVPILPVKRADGTYSYIFTDLNAYSSQLDAPTTPNPVSLAREVSDSLSDTRVLGNLFAQYEVIPGLQFRTSLGVDYADRWRYTYYPRTTLRGSQANGEALRAESNSQGWLNENTLTYQRELGSNSSVTLLGGYTRQRTDGSGSNMRNSQFVSDITGYYDIGSGTQEGGPTISSRESSQRLESWLGRVNYSLLDRYLLTATWRADGSSRFAANHKWGQFPSVALAWRASSEPWFMFDKSVQELKIRGSYGIVGNPSIRPYQSLARLNDQGYPIGGTPSGGYYPIAVGNPDLTWETTSQFNVGADVSFLKRFTFTGDYYTKKTTDLLLQISLPFETGFETALANRGAVENKGFELGLDAQVIQGTKGAFSWRANLNVARNTNKVTDLGGPDRIFADLITSDYNLPGTVIQVGQPIGVFYGFQSLGIIRDSAQAAQIHYTNFNGKPFQPGNMLIADIDGDSAITLNDRTLIGDPTPDITWGLTNTFGFRGFELTGLLQGSHGNKLLNINRIRTESSPRVNILASRFRDAWTPTHTDAKYPKIGENPNQVGPNNFTSNLLEDGSYVRLRSLTLSYAVPQAFASRYNVNGARVYVTGTNLFTITDYSGFDPDISGQSVGNVNRGIDIGAYPSAKAVTVGLSLNY
ncbi:MAG TPA: TonB-dependent receptor [Gemmatimonadaceae bacterium]